MLQACKICNQLYDNLKYQSICPHRVFPTLCKTHLRFNCGSLKCNSIRGELREIKRREA